MSLRVGIEGKFFLHPHVCIDLDTGLPVPYTKCGFIVDNGFIKTNNATIDVPPGEHLLPQGGPGDLKAHLQAAKSCFTGATGLFAMAMAVVNMMALSLVVVFTGAPGVGKTKILVT